MDMEGFLMVFPAGGQPVVGGREREACRSIIGLAAAASMRCTKDESNLNLSSITFSSPLSLSLPLSWRPFALSCRDRLTCTAPTRNQGRQSVPKCAKVCQSAVVSHLHVALLQSALDDRGRHRDLG